MRSNTVFYINEGMVKLFQVSGLEPRSVTAMFAVDIAGQNDEEISQTLAGLIKNRKINLTESRVTLLIPRSRVILRTMLFPSQNEEEIRSMIELQAGGSIPYAIEEVEIDFQILARSPDGYAKVAVVIIPQETAMRYWKIFSNAKIPVHAITISSIGLWLLYRHLPELSENPGAVIDLDIDHSEICLCDKTHWLTSREIPGGFAQMKNNGFAEFLKQWELTKRNIAGEKLNADVGSVFLAGSVEVTGGLSEEMAQAHHELTIKTPWPRLVNADGVSMASLAGIAFSTEAPPVNLIPKAIKKAQEERAYLKRLIICAIWATGALVSLGLALGMGYFKKDLQLARINDQIRATRQEAISVDEQYQKIRNIERIINGRLIFSDLAHDIYRLLPLQVYLVSIAVTDGNMVSFQGVSSNSVDINQFQKDMVNSHQFSNVNLDYVNKRVTPQGEVDYFKITCAFKTAGGQK